MNRWNLVAIGITLMLPSSLIILTQAKSEFPQRILTCRIPGLVALTFDDGPSPNGNTKQLLRVLREKGVKATFFVTGNGHDKTFLDTDERKQILLREIFQDGHQIGSHTWTHSHLTRNKTNEEIRQDISYLGKTVRDILGINMTIFRAPYGELNNTVIDLIQEEFGYKIIRWNLDTKDWYHGKNIENSFKIYEHLMESDDKVHLNTSFISLHHDPVPRSAELAAKVIDYVRLHGFRLVTIDECIGIRLSTKMQKTIKL